MALANLPHLHDHGIGHQAVISKVRGMTSSNTCQEGVGSKQSLQLPQVNQILKRRQRDPEQHTCNQKQKANTIKKLIDLE